MFILFRSEKITYKRSLIDHRCHKVKIPPKNAQQSNCLDHRNDEAFHLYPNFFWNVANLNYVTFHYQLMTQVAVRRPGVWVSLMQDYRRQSFLPWNGLLVDQRSVVQCEQNLSIPKRIFSMKSNPSVLPLCQTIPMDDDQYESKISSTVWTFEHTQTPSRMHLYHLVICSVCLL